jgi:hypothetical protein
LNRRTAAPDRPRSIQLQRRVSRSPPAGQQLRALQEFTFDVSAEEMGEGGEFTRRLLLGPFHPTTKIDYCDPSDED